MKLKMGRVRGMSRSVGSRDGGQKLEGWLWSIGWRNGESHVVKDEKQKIISDRERVFGLWKSERLWMLGDMSGLLGVGDKEDSEIRW